MQSVFGVLCFSTTFVAMAYAWYNDFDNTVYGGWTPDRRSHRTCVQVGQTCYNSRQCCDDESGSTICRMVSTYGFGRCEIKEPSYDFSIPDGEKIGTKKTNEECRESYECADQCCRVVKLGRLGKKYTCGKARRFQCKGRQVMPAIPSDISNDIFGDY